MAAITTRARGWWKLGQCGAGLAFILTLLGAGPSGGEAAVLEVTAAGAETLPEEIAAKARGVKGVARVERYLLLKAQPHDVIGVEPEAPLRVVAPAGNVVEAKLESGKGFRKDDDGKNVAVVGSRVYAEDYGYRSGATGQMATMKHLLEVGQTFKLTGEAGPRIRVLGTVSAPPESAAATVFLPLGTARKLFDREGKLSHLFLVTEGDADAVAQELASALGTGVRVRVISR